MLRERLSMAFFRRLGLPAPREAHARLFVNDTFVGRLRAGRDHRQGLPRPLLRRGQQGRHRERRLSVRVRLHARVPVRVHGLELDEYKIFKPKTHEKDADAQIWGPIEDMVKAVNETPDAIFNREVSTYWICRSRQSSRHRELPRRRRRHPRLRGDEQLLPVPVRGLEAIAVPGVGQGQHVPRGRLRHHERVGENVLARRTLALPQYRNNYFNSCSTPRLRRWSRTARGRATRTIAAGLARARGGRSTRRSVRPGAPTPSSRSNDDFEASMDGLLTFARERADFVKEQVGQRR